MKINLKLQEELDWQRPSKYELQKYLIEDGKKHPFALICPGGGYGCVCSFVEGIPYMEELHKRGYSVFILYYRIGEEARYPNPQDDVARALRDILDHAEEYGVETEGYSLWGSSAGGHLVGSFGTENMGYKKYGLPKPATIVQVYPVVTMGEYTHPGSRDNLLGLNATQEMIDFASVEKNVTENYPPTFVWCGDADDLVPPVNSHMLAAALKEHGVPHVFEEYSGVGHGVGVGKGLVCEPWMEHAIAFWEGQRKKVVLFDLDGTLLPMDQDDFIKAYFGGLVKMLAVHGYDPEIVTKSIWAGTGAMMKNNGECTNEDTFWKNFAGFFGDKVYDDAPYFEEFYRTEFQKVADVCGFAPQANEVIQALKKANTRIVLATNPLFPAVATYSRIRWAGMKPEDFELVTTYENSRYCKPNLKYYEDILATIGVAPEECLMVGNDVSEDMIAEKLGMKVFLLTDCLINKDNVDISKYPNGSFGELMEFLKGLELI